MPRRSGGPGITLFSFPDIITSVSGIMIFITLILALELMDKAQKGGAAAAVSHDAADLKARIAAAKAELDTLKQRTLAAMRSVGRSSLADERTAQEAAERVEQAERELVVLEQRAAAARTREEESRIRKAGVDAATVEQKREKDTELETLRRKLAAARNGELVYFNIDANSDAKRNGWIALLEGNGITIAPIGRPMKPRLFAGPDVVADDRDPVTNAFMAWAEREARGVYFLLVARPSGSRRLDPLVEALSSARRSYGLDLVTETQQIIDPEHGVFRP